MEHKYAVKNNDRRSGIAVHVWDMGHRPNWEAAEVLNVESQYVRRRVWKLFGLETQNMFVTLTVGWRLVKLGHH